MKQFSLFILSLLAGAFSRADAQVDSTMKSWQEYVTPGEMHKLMATWNGLWTAEIKIWAGADAEPLAGKGTLVNKMEMGGLYQVSNFTANMMGTALKGMGTLGFDNYNKIFESSWIDNMSSSIVQMKGDWDAATKTLTLQGRTIDVMTKKEIDIREILRIVDKNTQIMEMYGPDPQTGTEYKTMEIKYTRKK